MEEKNPIMIHPKAVSDSEVPEFCLDNGGRLRGHLLLGHCLSDIVLVL